MRQNSLSNKAKETRFDIDCIETFVDVLRFIKQTKKVLSSEDGEYAGFKAMIEEFFVELRRILLRSLHKKGSREIDLLLQRINEYVMKKIHKQLWCFNPEQDS